MFRQYYDKIQWLLIGQRHKKFVQGGIDSDGVNVIYGRCVDMAGAVECGIYIYWYNPNIK